LNHFETGLAACFIERRFHQLAAKPLLLVCFGHVHAEQGHFVPSLLTVLKGQADNPGQFVAVEPTQQPIQRAVHTLFPPAQWHRCTLGHAGRERLRISAVCLKHQGAIRLGVAGPQRADDHAVSDSR
jgi:hypothetical protein